MYHYLFYLSFQIANRFFVILFENNEHRTSYKRCFHLTSEIKHYNVMIDGKNFFDQPFKNDLRKYYSIREIAVGQVDDYTNGCLLDYNYFKYSYKMIAID